MIHFTITEDSFEILIVAPEYAGGPIDPQELTESAALLGSLMDEAELNTEEHNRPAIRLLKYRPLDEE